MTLYQRLFPGRNGHLRARWRVARVILIALAFWAASVVIVAYPVFAPGERLSELAAGDLAPRDISAPRDIVFVSQSRTQALRDEAAAAVQPIYDAPDPQVARIQAARAREIFSLIAEIRDQPEASSEEKSAALAEISDLSLSAENRLYLLALEAERWQQLQQQIVGVLEWVMRDSIRLEDLPFVRRARVPLAVSLTFNAEEAALIVDIAADLVRQNTLENPELTAAARQEAADLIEPATRSFIAGERIVSARQRINELQWEALAALGLTSQEENRWFTVLQAGLASALMMALGALYLWRWPAARLRQDGRLLASLVGAVVLSLLLARFLAGEDRIYVYPAAALGLVFVNLAMMQGLLLSLLPLTLLLVMMAGGSLEIGTMLLTGGLAGALFLRRSARFSDYFIASLLIAVAHLLILVVFQLVSGANLAQTQTQRILLFAVLNGPLSVFVALAALYAITALFNQTTSFKLIELARPSHPLLQRLLREAPGTYTHSLQVANLSEQAAQAIGADAELAQVASLYHDIGKVLHPKFYIENLAEMGNPHDALADPYRSAHIIIDHVRDGDRLAKEERLPRRIRDFIREHHGTMLNTYFYRRAREQRPGQEIEAAAFRYPGPRPRSRETAILMLADSCEAAARARSPKTRQEVADIVEQIFNERREERQLDEAPLTLKELSAVRDVIIDMLQASYHPRIDYRPDEEDGDGEEAAAPAKSDRPAAPRAG